MGMDPAYIGSSGSNAFYTEDNQSFRSLETKKAIIEDIKSGDREMSFELKFTPVIDETKAADPDGIFDALKPFDEDMNTKSRTEKSKHDIANRMMSDDKDDETEILFDDDEEE